MIMLPLLPRIENNHLLLLSNRQTPSPSPWKILSIKLNLFREPLQTSQLEITPQSPCLLFFLLTICNSGSKRRTYCAAFPLNLQAALALFHLQTKVSCQWEQEQLQRFISSMFSSMDWTSGCVSSMCPLSKDYFSVCKQKLCLLTVYIKDGHACLHLCSQHPLILSSP